MATANSEGSAQKSSFETFQLFSSSASGFGIFDDAAAQQVPAIPPPPCVEVLASEVPSSVKHNAESVNLDGVTLLKGRVNTQQVFGLSNSDLVPGKYEGGLKLWEGSLDLIKALRSDIKNGLISFGGKRVLEVGCGHGLPGIFALLEGAAAVHFQDFNAEVLRCLTIPNLDANLCGQSQQSSSNLTSCDKAEVRFFAGDWSEIDKLLPHVSTDAKLNQGDGYDFILMAETVYAINSLQNLYNLVKKCLKHPDGVVYMAAKKYYFGVGGGTRRFLSVVEKDGVMISSLVAEITDGSSNVREVWKLAFK
ncbi:histidine protein methyltransferase 1 homolog isoform X2 [Abrus precatorius]|uniref:protein-histidine N-methyltransferase n=1 Tax=Abrus precatorius TaxID=3816 RepID=A0A8B8JYK5_ABRPR|nr:histidine protein methyltransferase 1 homolog isoform X2 [Abrus precatorius]